MFNYNSPIVGNTMGMGYGANQQGFVPPNPIGNIMNIGSMGYNNNGGYYSGYNNYYNPYMIAKQQEIAQAKMREEQRQQSDLMKMISKKVNNYLGNDISDEQLDKMYDPVEENPVLEKEQRFARLMNLHYNGIEGNPVYMRQIEYNNRMFDKAKEILPDSTTLYEFTEKASPLLEEIVMREYRSKQRKDISKLYNSNDYKQLVIMHSSSKNYFSSVYDNNTSIDDESVSLPTHLQNTYAQKKAEFMKKILGR